MPLMRINKWLEQEFTPCSRLPKPEVRLLIEQRLLPGCIVGQHAFIDMDQWNHYKWEYLQQIQEVSRPKNVHLERALDKLGLR